MESPSWSSFNCIVQSSEPQCLLARSSMDLLVVYVTFDVQQNESKRSLQALWDQSGTPLPLLVWIEFCKIWMAWWFGLILALPFPSCNSIRLRVLPLTSPWMPLLIPLCVLPVKEGLIFDASMPFCRVDSPLRWNCRFYGCLALLNPVNSAL